MRTFVPFALSLIGAVAFTADASALGKRGSGCSGGGYGGGCYGGGYGGCSGGGYRGGYVSSGYGCGGGGCYGNCYCGGSAYSGYGVTYGGPVGYPTTYSSSNYSVPYSTWSGAPVTVSGGRAAMIQTTNGAYYTLGADGNYYPAGMSGYATQPYYGTTGVYGSSSYYPAGVYPAGYPGSYYGPGVIPAGGTPPLTMPAAAPATTKSLRAKEVLGTKIMIQNNTQVGTVEDIVFDDAGNMDYLIVSTDDKKLVTVPWDAAKFDGEKKTATVDITQDGWKALPTYTTTTYPQFYTSAYRTDIYKAYGLTPRVLRPIERRVP